MHRGQLFPKTNSFIRGSSQPLTDMHEFAGKIRAMKEAQRGETYRKAGADAVLIHSSKKNAGEILEFKKEWGDRLPLVIVPTKYYTTPTEAFREAGFKIVIWANHLMRSALMTMQATAKQIFQDQSLIDVEEKVAPLAEVFRLQGEPELEAEKAYLPRGGAIARGIVLAAGRGDELGDLTKDKPKCMLPASGKPILAHILDAYRSANVRDLVVVRGYAKEAVNLPDATYVDKDAFATTGELASLACAKTFLDGPCLVSYGDVLFKKHVLDEPRVSASCISRRSRARPTISRARRSRRARSRSGWRSISHGLKLLNPGPVSMTDRVRKALAAEDVCHREPEFKAAVARVREKVAAVYGAKGYTPVLIAGSGTAAVETMLSVVSKDRTSLVVANGVYGERMAAMLKAQGKRHEIVSAPWTSGMDLAATEKALATGTFSHVLAVHHETTTGRLNDVAALGALCQNTASRSSSTRCRASPARTSAGANGTWTRSPPPRTSACTARRACRSCSCATRRSPGRATRRACTSISIVTPPIKRRARRRSRCRRT